MNKKNKSNNIVCSFCDISQEEVDLLIEGNNAHICNLCISKSQDILDSNNSKNQDNEIKLLKPTLIKKKLDKYIIDQHQAKKYLSVAVYNHYKRLFYNKSDKINIDKSNILLIGPTGTGKTLLAKTLASIINVPFAIVDATVLTEAGYVGEDVENILVRLYHEAGYDIDKAQKGIIYIDEIDKISRKNSNPSITRDVSGEGVQQSLLKIIEGTIANVPPEGGRKHPEQPLVKIDTSNVLFICGGTFEGINNIIERRIKGTSIGFEKEKVAANLSLQYLSQIKSEDIVKFGFLPELVGRLPIISALNTLGHDAFYTILTQPINAIIKQYIHLFKIDNIKLDFTEEALHAIVDKAIRRKIGARALRSVLEEIMMEIMFELPTKKNVMCCTITKDVVNYNQKPELTSYKKSA